MATGSGSKPDTTEYAAQVRARIQKALPWESIPEDPKLSQVAEYARRANVEPGDWY